MNKIYMARWIKPDFEAGEAACEFVRSFHAAKPVKRAVLTVSALGVYAARVNGEKISYVLAPGWTSYRHRVQYQEYDVTHLRRSAFRRSGSSSRRRPAGGCATPR